MRKHKDIPGQMPLWEPPSEWRCPKEFPNLNNVDLIGFDVETKDPHLKSKGPGFIRGDAKVVGFSMSTGDASWYFPFDHEYGKQHQMPRESCLKFLESIVGDTSKTLVGANTMYEREAIWSLGITCKAKIFDIQIAEPLIDEEKPASLEEIARRRLGQSKDEEKLNEAAKDFGVDPKGGLWMLSPIYVGAYAEWDAWAPVHIWHHQMKEIREQGLDEVLQLELAIQPILWEMRLRGIPVDVDAARQLSKEYYAKETIITEHLAADYGAGLPRLDIWSGVSLKIYCDKHGLQYPTTPKGNPSFTKEFLEGSSFPFLKKVRDAREYNRLASTFIDGWIVGNQINGWVHPQWKQLASDDGGTRTGRMAASNPNPQQVPSRSKSGKRIRGLFCAPPGSSWAKLDYSQQEPRILIGFAERMGLPGATDAAQVYRDNPDQDFYNLMVQLASVERPQAKDLYLGRCYGMGIDKLAAKLRCDHVKARAILDQFDHHVPFVKQLGEKCEQAAQNRGFIRTLSGRRRHFNMWEPANFGAACKVADDCYPVDTRELALEKWKGVAIRRADTRKALNALIQGSAADMTKFAMLKVFNELGHIPYMQVHDELNYPVSNEDEAQAIKQCMETCVDISVPIKVDLDYGTSWK